MLRPVGGEQRRHCSASTGARQQATSCSGPMARRGGASVADRGGEGAAGGEAAAGGHGAGLGTGLRHAARDGLEPGGGGREGGHRGEERQRVGVLRVGEQGGDGGLLHDAAGVHDGDVVGDLGHHAEVVGDEQDGGAGPGAQLGQKGQDLGLDGDVQRRGGLVGNEQGGAAGQRHGDHDPLAEAAGKLVRVGVQTAFRAPACGPGATPPAHGRGRRCGPCRGGAAGLPRSGRRW